MFSAQSPQLHSSAVIPCSSQARQRETLTHLNAPIRALGPGRWPSSGFGTHCAQCAWAPCPWLDAHQAAEYLKVKVRTLLSWARSGKVKAYPLSGSERRRYRFHYCDLDAMLLLPSGPSSRAQ